MHFLLCEILDLVLEVLNLDSRLLLRLFHFEAKQGSGAFDVASFTSGIHILYIQRLMYPKKVGKTNSKELTDKHRSNYEIKLSVSKINVNFA